MKYKIEVLWDDPNSKLGNKIKLGEIGLNIRTHASPRIGQDHVLGGVSVPCQHAKPAADALCKPIFRNIFKIENKSSVDKMSYLT